MERFTDLDTSSARGRAKVKRPQATPGVSSAMRKASSLIVR